MKYSWWETANKWLSETVLSFWKATSNFLQKAEFSPIVNYCSKIGCWIKKSARIISVTLKESFVSIISAIKNAEIFKAIASAEFFRIIFAFAAVTAIILGVCRIVEDIASTSNTHVVPVSDTGFDTGFDTGSGTGSGTGFVPPKKLGKGAAENIEETKEAIIEEIPAGSAGSTTPALKLD